MTKLKNKNENLEDITFEKAFENLQMSVKELESGDLSLTDATNLYEKGMKLVALCNEILTKTELKISEIKNTYAQEDFIDNNEE
ncbi:MAG: exodeoxyribonuclease VII small subunit [SAR202 cluster bacterium]|nr:exodeoxyribonuclease VII small subunit [SAR202 cluster bacterium]|tara:strand:+ start:15730 stop:15981 length:252 start_codon:yes stop_codon:yes gene_type:complete